MDSLGRDLLQDPAPASPEATAIDRKHCPRLRVRAASVCLVASGLRRLSGSGVAHRPGVQRLLLYNAWLCKV